MAAGDVFQLKDKQLVFAQEAMNVYYYEAGAGDSTAEDVALTWIADVLPSILDVQTSNVTHLSVEVINLDNVGDFHEEVFGTPVPGVIGSDPMPSYVAWAFKFNRSDRTVRNGRKAIAGVAENATSGNNPTASALTDLETAADAMGATLELTSGAFIDPVIYGKPTPPPSSLPLRVVDVASVTFNRLSTQNTRKNW